GGDYKKIRLTFQEYFERVNLEPLRWGKPFSALIGALYAQKSFGTPAIGGKDSMSGTFKDMNVPPTLVAFAVDTVNVNNVISSEFKKVNSNVILVKAKRIENELPDFDLLKRNFDKVTELIAKGKVISASTVKTGGVAEAVSKMAFGNMIGFAFDSSYESNNVFEADYGSIILEAHESLDLKEAFGEVSFEVIGKTQSKESININSVEISLDEALNVWKKPLEKIFPTKTEKIEKGIENVIYDKRGLKTPVIKIAKPKIFMTVFPGTNCEYDSKKSFERAGGSVETLVFRNLSSKDIEESVEAMVKGIKSSQIVMLPGGFSAGDEPDGSGKFIAAVFRNERVKEAVNDLLKNRDGLMLGICNGFQALIKLGLVPFGEIRDIDENCPTLTYNKIGRHVSCMVRTKITSTLSPWFSSVNAGDIHLIPVSHGEGRFVASESVVHELIKNGQVATQYVDMDGNASYDIRFNPNGSVYGIEGITSPDGRILGKMGHSERTASDLLINIPGEKDQKIFESGVKYFK
ncbi:MAG: phosphoribosylformylglycinamidine synthase subunit PurQ, partial [Bacillota bacterium]|nr:phosphoribosylformylglycinamidine synthase subunit PurQ [Bacillota bacterium]